MTRPLIGITSAYVQMDGRPYNRMYAPNARAIAAAGGLPVFIPTHLDDDTLRALYDQMDAVLLPGGPDVDPAVYGRERHPLTIHIDDPRDQLELRIARWAVAEDTPVLGICRGHQVLNVALGGTLVQDIPSEVQTSMAHDQPNGLPRSQRLHSVRIAPESRLAAILGADEVQVNSLHHQAVDRPAPGVVITATAPDGVPEALEMPGKPFVLSVQWHPEDLYTEEDSMRRLFAAFVEAASQRRAARERAHAS